MKKMTSTTKGYLFALITAICWSLTGLFVKFINQSVYLITLIPAIIGFLINYTVDRKKIKISRFIVIVAICQLITHLTFVLANKLTSVGNAIILQYSSMVFVLIYECIDLKKRPKPYQLLVVLMAFTGMFIFFVDSLSIGNMLGNTLALVSGMFFGLQFYLNTKNEADPYSSVQINYILTWIYALVGIFVTGINPLSISDICFLGLSGLIATGLAGVAFIHCINKIPAFTANIICMSEVIFAPLWSMIFLGEFFTPVSFVGALMMICALSFNIYKQRGAKQMYESIMWTYIKQEPQILNNIIDDLSIKNTAEKLKDVNRIIFTAHGSSYNAAMSIAPLLSRYAKVQVNVLTPSNFLHNYADCGVITSEKGVLVVGISQTGTSRGVIEALNVAKSMSMTVLSLTNVSKSPVDEISDYTLYLNCGEEDSNAKTKGYSSTLALLLMFTLYLGKAKGLISEDESKKYISDIRTEVGTLAEVVKGVTDWCEKTLYGKNMHNLYVIGDGVQFGTAMEAQLKLMETMCIPTMFNDIIEFSHGMHRSIDKRSFVMLIDDGTEGELVRDTYKYLKNEGVSVLVISNQDYYEDDDSIIKIGYHSFQHSILSIVCAIQVISVYVPELNGFDPNRDANNSYTVVVGTRV